MHIINQNKTYECFSFSGKSINCYGLEIVKNILSRYGYKVLPFEKHSKNPVIVSLYWPEQLLNFIKFRYQSCMRGRTVIVGGNYATTSPQALFPFADYVFLGDGELWDGSFDSPYLVTKDTCKPTEKAIAKHILPFLYEDVQVSRRAFVEMSRGCKNKCPFCQYGWLKPYRESSYQDIEEIIKRVKTKSVRCFAADRYQHSRYLKIRRLLEKLGKCDTGSDISMRFIFKHPEYLKFTKKVRIGVEGLSYRLRKMVHKPYTNKQILEFCKMVADAGIKCLDFYMIYGLPTETKEDVDEFEQLLDDLENYLPVGYVIAIHWNSFSPSAQTPFQWEMPAHGEYRELYHLLHSKKHSKRIKIYHKPKLTSDITVIRRTLTIRSDMSISKLCFSFAMNKTKFEKNPDFILGEYKRNSGIDLLGPWPEEKEMPWDRYVVYNKEKMLSVCKSAKEKAII